MALEVYWASGSPFSWRVLLTLEVKQLPYQLKLLTFSQREHKSPEYLALNPRGKVPTLKDDDFLLYESLAIMTYLDSKYPERPLFGRTPQEIGTIWRLVSEGISYVCDPIGKVVGPLFFGGAAEKETEIRMAATALGSGQVFLTVLGSDCHKRCQAKHPQERGGHDHDTRSGRI